MRILKGTRRGALVSRPNRWTIVADLQGRRVQCFCPNPGRLRELLRSGSKVLVRPQISATRKTKYDLVAVREEDQWVSIDTRLPNRLVRDALLRHRLPPFNGYTGVRPEFPFGHSRLDFLLEGPRLCLLEVKSCSLVCAGVAQFPDAPSTRATRHLHALMAARAQGHRAALMFVVQRPDAWVLRPLDAVDPSFGATLRQAKRSGVEILAYRCQLRNGDLSLDRRIAIDLSEVAPSD